MAKALQANQGICSSRASPKHEWLSGWDQLQAKGHSAGRRGKGPPEGQNNAPNPTVRSEVEKRRKMGRTYLHNHLCDKSTDNSHTIFVQISRNLPLLPRSALPAVPGIVLCFCTRCVRPGGGSSGPELYNSRKTVLFVTAVAGILNVVAHGVSDPGTGWDRPNESPRKSSSSQSAASPRRPRSTALWLKWPEKYSRSVGARAPGCAVVGRNG